MTTTSESSLITSMKRKWPNRYHVQRISRSTLIYAFLLLLCAIIILPVGWMLTVSLKPDRIPVFTIPPEWFPSEHWEWNNFIRNSVELTKAYKPMIDEGGMRKILIAADGNFDGYRIRKAVNTGVWMSQIDRIYILVRIDDE